MAPPPNRRPGFSRRAQNALFFSYVLTIAGAIVGAVLVTLSAYDPPAFAALRSAAAEFTVPVAGALGSARRNVAGVPASIGDWVQVHGENGRLRAQMAVANRLVTRARVLNGENTRLRRLLHLRDASPDSVVSARVVSSTAGSTRRYGLLNAGLWQGVREGQPVEGPDGLIGRVVETGPNTARVLLLVDPDSIVPVRRARDGLPAIVAGRGDALVEVRSVNPAAGDIQPGDLFVTSGAGGIFAPDVPVARVTRRTNDGGLARVLADPDALDVALVHHAFLPPPPPPRRAKP